MSYQPPQTQPTGWIDWIFGIDDTNNSSDDETTNMRRLGLPPLHNLSHQTRAMLLDPKDPDTSMLLAQYERQSEVMRAQQAMNEKIAEKNAQSASLNDTVYIISSNNSSSYSNMNDDAVSVNFDDFLSQNHSEDEKSVPTSSKSPKILYKSRPIAHIPLYNPPEETNNLSVSMNSNADEMSDQNEGFNNWSKGMNLDTNGPVSLLISQASVSINSNYDETHDMGQIDENGNFSLKNSVEIDENDDSIHNNSIEDDNTCQNIGIEDEYDENDHNNESIDHFDFLHEGDIERSGSDSPSTITNSFIIPTESHQTPRISHEQKIISNSENIDESGNLIAPQIHITFSEEHTTATFPLQITPQPSVDPVLPHHSPSHTQPLPQLATALPSIITTLPPYSPTLKQSGKSKSISNLYRTPPLSPTPPLIDNDEDEHPNTDLPSQYSTESIEHVLHGSNTPKTRQTTPNTPITAPPPQITPSQLARLSSHHKLLFRHLLISLYLEQANTHYTSLKRHIDVLFLCMKEIQGKYQKLALFVTFGEDFTSHGINIVASIIKMMSVDQQALLLKVNQASHNYTESLQKLNHHFIHESIAKFNPLEQSQPQNHSIQPLPLSRVNSMAASVDPPNSLPTYYTQPTLSAPSIIDLFQSTSVGMQMLSSFMAQFQDQHLGQTLEQMVHYRKLLSQAQATVVPEHEKYKKRLLALYPLIFTPWTQFYTLYSNAAGNTVQYISSLAAASKEARNLNGGKSQTKKVNFNSILDVNFPLQHQLLALQPFLMSNLAHITEQINSQRQELYNTTKIVTFGLRRCLLKAFQFISTSMQSILHKLEQNISLAISDMCVGIKHHAFPSYFTNPVLLQQFSTIHDTSGSNLQEHGTNQALYEHTHNNISNFYEPIQVQNTPQSTQTCASSTASSLFIPQNTPFSPSNGLTNHHTPAQSTNINPIHPRNASSNPTTFPVPHVRTPVQSGEYPTVSSTPQQLISQKQQPQTSSTPHQLLTSHHYPSSSSLASLSIHNVAQQQQTQPSPVTTPQSPQQMSMFSFMTQALAKLHLQSENDKINENNNSNIQNSTTNRCSNELLSSLLTALKIDAPLAPQQPQSLSHRPPINPLIQPLSQYLTHPPQQVQQQIDALHTLQQTHTIVRQQYDLFTQQHDRLLQQHTSLILPQDHNFIEYPHNHNQTDPIALPHPPMYSRQASGQSNNPLPSQTPPNIAPNTSNSSYSIDQVSNLPLTQDSPNNNYHLISHLLGSTDDPILSPIPHLPSRSTPYILPTSSNSIAGITISPSSIPSSVTTSAPHSPIGTHHGLENNSLLSQIAQVPQYHGVLQTGQPILSPQQSAVPQNLPSQYNLSQFSSFNLPTQPHVPQQSIAKIQHQYQHYQHLYYQQQYALPSSDLFSLNLTLPITPPSLVSLAALGVKAVLPLYYFKGHFQGGWSPVTAVLTRNNYFILFERKILHNQYFIDPFGIITHVTTVDTPQNSTNPDNSQENDQDRELCANQLSRGKKLHSLLNYLGRSCAQRGTSQAVHSSRSAGVNVNRGGTVCSSSNSNNPNNTDNDSTSAMSSPATTPTAIKPTTVQSYLPNILIVLNLNEAQLHITKTENAPQIQPQTATSQQLQKDDANIYTSIQNNNTLGDTSSTSNPSRNRTASSRGSDTGELSTSSTTSSHHSASHASHEALQLEKQHLSHYMISVTMQDTSFFALKSIHKTYNFTTSAVPFIALVDDVSHDNIKPHKSSNKDDNEDDSDNGEGMMRKTNITDTTQTTNSIMQQINPNNVDILVRFLSTVHDSVY